MSKRAIAFFVLAFVTMSAVSQASNRQVRSRCSLTEATSPSIRGLRLGMSTQQLLDLFPGTSKRREMKEALEKAKSATGAEAAYIAFDPGSDGNPQQFAGVESVSAGISKGRVVDLSVEYGGATWRNIDEWVAKLSESLKLPAREEWVTGPNENPNKVLRCDNLEIEAAIQGGGASIRLRSTEYFRGIEEQRNATEEKKRREYKP